MVGSVKLSGAKDARNMKSVVMLVVAVKLSHNCRVGHTTSSEVSVNIQPVRLTVHEN